MDCNYNNKHWHLVIQDVIHVCRNNGGLGDRTTKPVGHSDANTILLLDDEFDVTTSFRQLLRRQGFHVFGFTNPLLAVEHFQIYYKQYGLVISDVRIPEMSGYEFLKRVKEIKPEVKVFLMTAFEIDDIEIRRLLPSVTIDEFIQKPISSNSLISRIRKYIKNESDSDTVDKLNLPASLKFLLLNHGLTIEQLQNMKSREIAQILAIDDDTARIIISAVRGKSDRNVGY